MKFAREVHEIYQQAYAKATTSLEKAKKLGRPLCPADLNSLMEDRMISYRLDLGILDIPTTLIVGVTEASEKSVLYTREFLPLPAPKTEFAGQWRDIYHHYSRGEGLPGFVQCYEYLGRFYVVDGLKRVSIAKFSKEPTMRSQVIRIMPIRTDSKSVQLYYDFLYQFQMTRMYQLQFTQEGFFERLQTALGNGPTHKWTDSDRGSFLTVWPMIEEAFHKSYEDCLHITAADALVVVLEKYTIEQILQMQPWVLARIFQAFWKELYALSFPGISCKETQLQSETVLQTA